MTEGRRVLVSGMGSQLGSLVASQLEREPWVGALAGIDTDPPRRRLRRAEFHRIDPADRRRVIEMVTDFDPHVLVHIAVWEPDARASAAHAPHLTREAAVHILGAAAECPSLEHMVVRSGTEIYGRSRHSLTRPDETCAVNPTSEYGRMVERIEEVARHTADRVGVSLTSLRLAPVLGKHVPSPLGRLLRLPVVPMSLLADPAFAVVLESDAADAFVRAAARQVDGPVNVVGPGAITAGQAIIRGRRLPLPLIGPEWGLARRIAHVAGAPVPEHVVEVLHRGRLADGSFCAEALGWTPSASTSEIIDMLYAWPSIVRVPPQVAWEIAS
jgi:UDP-glucose 4-epimerase